MQKKNIERERQTDRQTEERGHTCVKLSSRVASFCMTVGRAGDGVMNVTSVPVAISIINEYARTTIKGKEKSLPVMRLC